MSFGIPSHFTHFFLYAIILSESEYFIVKLPKRIVSLSSTIVLWVSVHNCGFLQLHLPICFDSFSAIVIDKLCYYPLHNFWAEANSNIHKIHNMLWLWTPGKIRKWSKVFTYLKCDYSHGCLSSLELTFDFLVPVSSAIVVKLLEVTNCLCAYL